MLLECLNAIRSAKTRIKGILALQHVSVIDSIILNAAGRLFANGSLTTCDPIWQAGHGSEDVDCASRAVEAKDRLGRQPAGRLEFNLPPIRICPAPFGVERRQSFLGSIAIVRRIVNPQIDIVRCDRRMAQQKIHSTDQQVGDAELIHRVENQINVHGDS
jgi:hypothetical protein